MNTSYFLKLFYANAVVAAVFLSVFYFSLANAFAQPVNPGAQTGQQNQNTSYEIQSSYATTYYQNQYTQNTQTMAPLRVTTYEPSFSHALKGNSVTATLKGYVDVSTNKTLSEVWFEWGETTALGNKTPSRSVNVDFSFQTFVYDLSPEKTYYYRAVGQNSSGTVQGNIVTMRTPKALAREQGTVPSFAITSGGIASASASTANTPRASSSASSDTINKTSSNTSSATTNTNIAQETSITKEIQEKNERGIFPGTLFGWIVLSILVFIVVGFVVYLIDLYQELKQQQEEERKRRANGNGNGAQYGAPA